MDKVTVVNQNKLENNFFTQILIKLASRCNLNCSYCYWFRDKSVYDYPKILSLEIENFFINRLETYLLRYPYSEFDIIFHGGEPLLLGKERFNNFCTKLRNLESIIKKKLNLSITSNGILINKDWANIFKQYNVEVSISIDGGESVHDINRVDFSNKGTFKRVITNFLLLRSEGLDPGVLAVCLPHTDPLALLINFVDILGIKYFNILIPDITHEDNYTSISSYYINLFDYWYDKYAQKGVRISIIDSIIRGLLGKKGHVGSLGYGKITELNLLTDGTLEAHDLLRVISNGFTKSNYNVFSNELSDLFNNPLWVEAYTATHNLPNICQKCDFAFTCGGGPLQTRWSNASRFDNPSVYCDDIKKILHHAAKKISNDINYNSLST